MMGRVRPIDAPEALPPRAPLAGVRPLLAAVALAAAGCPAFTQPGPRFVKLEPARIKAVDLILVGGGATFCPSGELAQLKVVARTTDGKTLETWAGRGDTEGKLDFSSFEWSVSAGMVSGDGHYQPPPDPLAVLDQPVSIEVRVAGNPTVSATMSLSPVYDCGAIAPQRTVPWLIARRYTM